MHTAPKQAVRDETVSLSRLIQPYSSATLS